MPAPKNDELDMLRGAQRSGFSMRDTARRVAKSANSSADILLRQLAPKDPEIVGVDAQGRPLYAADLPFLPPQTAEQRAQFRQIAEGMIGGAPSAAGGVMSAMAGRIGRKPLSGQPALPMSSKPQRTDLALAGSRDVAPFRPPSSAMSPVQSPGPMALAGGGPTGMAPSGMSGSGAGNRALPAPPQVEVLPPSSNPFARPGRVVDPAMRAGLPSPTPMPNVSGYGARPFGDIPASFGDQFAAINYGPSLGPVGKGVAALGAGLGAAAGAGMLMGDGQSAAPQPSAMPAGQPAATQGMEFIDYMRAPAELAGVMSDLPLPDAQPVEPLRASGRNKRRGTPVTSADVLARQQRAAQAQPTPMPMRGAPQESARQTPGYWIDLFQAADAGDAYSRDFIALREQARQSAQQAAMQGEQVQYVPLMDYRNNRATIVNAAGNDVVLDLNDPQDRAEFNAIAQRSGDPTMFARRMSRASTPLLAYFQAPGQGAARPDFAVNETVRLPSRVM